MTLKRLLLSLLTFFVIFLVGSSLVRSWGEPQISSRLELYQTDLVLHAAEFQQAKGAAGNALVGEDPIGTSLKQYQDVRQSAETNLKKFQAQLQQLEPTTIAKPPAAAAPAVSSSDREAEVKTLRAAIVQQFDLLNQLDLRIGVLQAQKKQVAEAQKTWTDLKNRLTTANLPIVEAGYLEETVSVLQGLWSSPPRLLPDAEPQIQQHLDGWFRYTTLTQLYQLQQRPDALKTLQAVEQQTAQQTIVKLALVGTVPAIGSLIGAALLIFLIVQRVTQGKQSILADSSATGWETPWDWEMVWQVLIVGFFFGGQIAIPLLLALLAKSGLSFSAFGTRSQAISALVFYLLMASSTILVLYLSIKRFLPLPDGWFRANLRGRWFAWGLGGYFVALPLMIGVSIANQQIWQGQGGSNPLLQLVLEEGDRVSLAIFLFTAAVAAPIFEEILFRGFLLPSLTRYLPVWGSIALSSLIFATAHLSLSEILPLTVLGCVLGFVYTRSRNLLSSMLLHSLWNSITMVGLFILGSGG